MSEPVPGTEERRYRQPRRVWFWILGPFLVLLVVVSWMTNATYRRRVQVKNRLAAVSPDVEVSYISEELIDRGYHNPLDHFRYDLSIGFYTTSDTTPTEVNAFLKELRQVKRMEALALSGPHVDDVFLSRLPADLKVKHVMIDDSRVTVAGLDALCGRYVPEVVFAAGEPPFPVGAMAALEAKYPKTAFEY